jgi:hypothetical protein
MMRCLYCGAAVKAVQSDNLTIYHCQQPDCIVFGLYQTGIEDVRSPEALDLNDLAERIIAQHRDEPPVAPPPRRTQSVRKSS